MAPLKFFVYSNLFIAACAVLMAGQTHQLLLHAAPEPDFTSFVFFSTVCSYSFHWYLSLEAVPASSRAVWQHRYQYIHVILMVAGLAGAAIYFLFLIKYWFWLSLPVVATFLYTAPKIPNKHFRELRKIAYGKTILLTMIWMYVTTILPVIISNGIWRGDVYLFIISRFFMIYAICILFDYRDREDDKAKGIRSLITYLSEKNIRNLFAVSIVLFVVSTICLLFYQYSLLTVFILLMPGTLTAALYNYARKHFSDTLYYFVLDGLMALSSLLTLLIGN